MFLITYIPLVDRHFQLSHSVRRNDRLFSLTPTEELNTCSLLMTNEVLPALAINISWLTLFFLINGILRSIFVSEMWMEGAFKESFSVIREKSGRRMAETGISLSSLTLSPEKRDR